MHIALTGVSGFIGSFTARALRSAGHTVTGLVRASSRRDHIQPHVDRFVVGEQADESCWAELLDGADGLIHNSVDWSPLRASPVDAERHWRDNLLGSLKLIRTAMPRQVVFISTIAVHHDMRERWGGIIDEDHPTRPGSLYGAYKAAVEAHLWAMHFAEGLRFTALRPCGVYGLDPNIERSHGYELIQRIRNGETPAKPGGGKFVHVEDVAQAIVACVGNDAANAKVYNLVDCYARWADWAVMACSLLNVKMEIDLSSPPKARNMFAKNEARSLGVKLDRGHEGIRTHLAELIEALDARGGKP